MGPKLLTKCLKYAIMEVENESVSPCGEAETLKTQ